MEITACAASEPSLLNFLGGLFSLVPSFLLFFPTSENASEQRRPILILAPARCQIGFRRKTRNTRRRRWRRRRRERERKRFPFGFGEDEDEFRTQATTISLRFFRKLVSPNFNRKMNFSTLVMVKSGVLKVNELNIPNTKPHFCHSCCDTHVKNLEQ